MGLLTTFPYTNYDNIFYRVPITDTTYPWLLII